MNRIDRCIAEIVWAEKAFPGAAARRWEIQRSVSSFVSASREAHRGDAAFINADVAELAGLLVLRAKVLPPSDQRDFLVEASELARAFAPG
jgi:hypothetical protein